MIVISIFLENPVKQIATHKHCSIWLPIPLLAQSFSSARPPSKFLDVVRIELIIVFNRIELIEKQVNPGGFRLGSKRSLD